MESLDDVLTEDEKIKWLSLLNNRSEISFTIYIDVNSITLETPMVSFRYTNGYVELMNHRLDSASSSTFVNFYFYAIAFRTLLEKLCVLNIDKYIVNGKTLFLFNYESSLNRLYFRQQRLDVFCNQLSIMEHVIISCAMRSKTFNSNQLIRNYLLTAKK